jgi:hypothetical protein
MHTATFLIAALLAPLDLASGGAHTLVAILHLMADDSQNIDVKHLLDIVKNNIGSPACNVFSLLIPAKVAYSALHKVQDQRETAGSMALEIIGKSTLAVMALQVARVLVFSTVGQ